MEKGRRGKGERGEGRGEVRERGGKGERRGGGRGGDGGSTHSPYCHIISLSLQLCEEELKTEHVIHPLCIIIIPCHIPEQAGSTMLQCCACKEWLRFHIDINFV